MRNRKIVISFVPMFTQANLIIPCPYHDYVYRSWQPGQNMDNHNHPFLQIIHVLEGDFSIDTGDGWQTIHPGWAHILPPGFSHALKTDTGILQFGLNFRITDDERGWCKRLGSLFPTPCKVPAPLPPQLLHHLKSLPCILNEREELRLIHHFDEYCHGLLGISEQSGKEKRQQALLAFLESKTDQALSVDAIAVHMKISRSGLQELCSRAFHCGARTLHERIRIEHAARLLIQGTASVSTCANQCGFPDIYTFSRSFKRIKGCPPSQFRNAHL